MRIIPPIVAAFYLLVAWGLDSLFPGMPIIGSPYHLLGLVLFGVGGFLGGWAFLHFKKWDTPISTNATPTALVTTGPFRFSRSPIYVGLTCALLGIAVFVGTLPWFLVPLAFAITMHAAYIPREEAALERLFGQEYPDYKDRVRRWL
ncbi:MAG: isoprenylcysteine carboxylmethyltransferase family protein [bacterium]|nr:isoprenylcysteine carboxylmethyltransferase family protein [bacterium]